MNGLSNWDHLSQHKVEKKENEGVQVYLESQLMGYLQVPESAYRGKFVFISMMEEQEMLPSRSDLPAPGTLPPHLQLELKPRSVAIKQHELDQMSMLEPEDLRVMYSKRHKIPSYARSYLEPASQDMIYRWSALSLDADQYEKVFDLDCFNPV